jgi:hypothetical protein
LAYPAEVVNGEGLIEMPRFGIVVALTVRYIRYTAGMTVDWENLQPDRKLEVECSNWCTAAVKGPSKDSAVQGVAHAKIQLRNNSLLQAPRDNRYRSASVPDTELGALFPPVHGGHRCSLTSPPASCHNIAPLCRVWHVNRTTFLEHCEPFPKI